MNGPVFHLYEQLSKDHAQLAYLQAFRYFLLRMGAQSYWAKSRFDSNYDVRAPSRSNPWQPALPTAQLIPQIVAGDDMPRPLSPVVVRFIAGEGCSSDSIDVIASESMWLGFVDALRVWAGVPEAHCELV